MASKLNNALLGTVLLVLSGYSAAETPSAPSMADPDAVIVTGPYSTDREIRAEVIRRINEKPALRTESIDVQSFDHDVYLYAPVTSRMDSDQVDSIVHAVPGVKNVYIALESFGA